MIQKLSEGLDESKIIFYMVDIDQNDELSNKFNIKSVPTFLLFRDIKLENELDRCSGSDLNKVHQLIKKYI